MKQLTGKQKGRLDYIARVLAEAEREDRTAAERASFLTITQSNLREFLTVRCPCPEGEIRQRVTALFARMDALACALAPVRADDAEACVLLLRDERAACGEDLDDSRRAVEACLTAREKAPVVLIEHSAQLPNDRLTALTEAYPDAYVRRWPGHVPVSEQLAALMKDAAPAAKPAAVPPDLFAAVQEADRLLIHPYDPYDEVLALLEQAADDERVTSIRIALYRVKEHGSRVIDALCRAARRGCRVTAVVELRARGSERANLAAADGLTAAGASVVHPCGPRVHAKVLLIERTEGGETRRAAHFATGNYNEASAAHYTDVSLMTAEPALCEDAARFFAALTDAKTPACMALGVSPGDLRTELIRLIRREMSHAMAGRPCGVRAKVNALTDPQLIDVLEDAARLGVPIHLTVRGVCRLKPDRVGKNITVRSIVGRELEHARLCRFENGGTPETYLSSADWMPRSFDRRHELLVPVTAPETAARAARWLDLQARDTANAWALHMDEYTALRCSDDLPVDSQRMMHKQ